MTPARVVPVTCGMPYFLSRTMVTSLRGDLVLSTSAAATPYELSLKNVLIWSPVRPV
jgi:hypothetical protein